MEKIKINVYEFKELEEKIQERLIQEEKEAQRELYCEAYLNDDMKEKAEELLRKYFKSSAELKGVYYSLSYTQGSGAMIEFDLQYYNERLEVRQSGHYTHERSFVINSYNLSYKREATLNEKIVKMNCDLTKYGYNLIDSDNFTDAYAVERLEEDRYFIDGSIFNYK